MLVGKPFLVKLLGLHELFVPDTYRAVIAELIGTFILEFIGLGAFVYVLIEGRVSLLDTVSLSKLRLKRLYCPVDYGLMNSMYSET